MPALFAGRLGLKQLGRDRGFVYLEQVAAGAGAGGDVGAACADGAPSAVAVPCAGAVAGAVAAVAAVAAETGEAEAGPDLELGCGGGGTGDLGNQAAVAGDHQAVEIFAVLIVQMPTPKPMMTCRGNRMHFAG